MADRLDGYLSHRGFGSRSEVKQLIRKGSVHVDGVECSNPSQHIVPGTNVIEVNGVIVEVGLSEATLIFHKPVGVSCSHDEREEPLIESCYPVEYAKLGLEPAGRLDRMTSGLLIVTTEGDLIHRLTNPRKKLPKRYRIVYSGTLSAHAVERCANGIDLEGDPGPTLPAKLVLLDQNLDGLNNAMLTIHEGRYHQVRRMIAALGGEVIHLHRDRIGSLDLPRDLQPGAIRPITEQELSELQTVRDDTALLGDIALGARRRT